jgi:hypothetical protein
MYVSANRCLQHSGGTKDHFRWEKVPGTTLIKRPGGGSQLNTLVVIGTDWQTHTYIHTCISNNLMITATEAPMEVHE